VNFPINAKFPASKAVEVMRAFNAFVEKNKPMLDQHGIRLACNALLHGHFWGIEPVMFWRRPLGEYRGHFAPADRAAATAGVENDAETTTAAIDFRYRLTAMFRSMGSLHVQWAKAYPFADALEDQTAWDIICKFKDIADPDRTINPGLLRIE